MKISQGNCIARVWFCEQGEGFNRIQVAILRIFMSLLWFVAITTKNFLTHEWRYEAVQIICRIEQEEMQNQGNEGTNTVDMCLIEKNLTYFRDHKLWKNPFLPHMTVLLKERYFISRRIYHRNSGWSSKPRKNLNMSCWVQDMVPGKQTLKSQ